MNLVARFLLTGATGALLSLAVTWVLTTYVVGTEHYFSAYLVGIAVNLLFNFIAYTVAVFKTKHDHLRRLLVFLFYGIIMAFLQGATVRLIAAVLGSEWYLFIIAGVIGVFAVLNFFIFKLAIFKEYEAGHGPTTKTILVFIAVAAILLRLAVLFNVLSQAGVSPLVYGDAYGYLELAGHLATGEGFTTARTTGELVPEVFRTPGLPLLLAPFTGSDTMLAWYLLLLALAAGALLPVITYALGAPLLGRTAALIVAFLISFEPHLVFFSVLPQTEIPFMVFAYGGFAAVGMQVRRPLLYAAFAGALIGFAVLIKPGFLPVFALGLFCVLVYAALFARGVLTRVGVLCAALMLTLLPWFIRTHEVTRVWALSGAGWRNVYTDYVASVRAIEKGTEFSIEKKQLKEESERAGVPTAEVDNPAYGGALRRFALSELWEKKETVVKLETTLLVSYFLQDGYYYQFTRFLLIPGSEELSRVSPTFLLLKDGLAAVPAILTELSHQYFIPILGRLWTGLIFLSALVGFFLMRHPFRYLFAFLIALSALAATAIGLGVEARLRLPMLPLLYLLAVAAWTRLYPLGRLWYLHAFRPRDSRL